MPPNSSRTDDRDWQTIGWYRSLIENLNDAIFTLDVEGHFTYMSPVFERYTGYPADEAVGKHFTHFMHPDDAARVREVFRKRLAGHLGPTEFRWFARDGRVLHIQTSTRPLIEDGRLVGLTGVATDITQRKQADEQLRATRERLQHIVNSEMLGIIVLYEDGRVVEANDYYLRLVRATHEDLAAGRVNWHTITLPQHRGRNERAFAELRRRGVCTPFEKEYVLPDGTHVPVLVGLALLPGDEGLMSGFVLDITERRQAEGQIRQLNVDLQRRVSELRALFDALPVSVGIAEDPDCTRITANPSLAKVLGMDPAGNTSPTAASPPYQVMRRGQLLAPQEMPIQVAAARGVATSNDELDIVRADGEVTNLLGYAVPLFDEHGKTRGSVGVFVDVTEQKRQQEALRKSEQQLRHAQKMEAIGLLAGGVAHDFRNQLTVIKGYSQMLLRRNMVDAAAREYVEEILRAADRSATLTGELLSFSRRQILRPETIDLNDQIQQMAKPLQAMCGEHIRLTIVPADNLAAVRIDPAPLQQALVNLAANARDAMPDGGELIIETANTARPAGNGTGDRPHVMVAVRDTGVGMDEQTRSRVFEPFFTTKPVGQGTGLGMPMVYGFVQQSGGHVEVDSKPGEGATLRLYFPQVAGPAGKARPALTDQPLPRGRGTILLVEDEDAIRSLLAQTLHECGYFVLQARDSREALQVAARVGHIDLLLSDVVMPGGSGPDLAEQLRMAQPDLRTLFVSGHTGGARGPSELDDGRVDLVVKPFDAYAISVAVRRAIAQP